MLPRFAYPDVRVYMDGKYGARRMLEYLWSVALVPDELIDPATGNPQAFDDRADAQAAAEKFARELYRENQALRLEEGF